MRRVLETLLLAWLVHASPSHADSLIDTVAEFTASLSAESTDTPREIASVAQRFEAAGLAARLGQARFTPVFASCCHSNPTARRGGCSPVGLFRTRRVSIMFPAVYRP